MLSMTSTFHTEGSIQGQQMPEDVSADDSLVLRRRQEAYKKFSADVAQISDGRSLEMFRRNNCPSLLVVGKTKTSHGNVITTNKVTRHDPKNPLLPLAATCPTLYSKLAQEIATSCTNLSATVAPESNLIVRPKHHPLHRCPSTNSMVVGIVKPSRYSEGGSLNASSSTIDLKQLSGYPTQLKGDDVASKSIRRTTSLVSVHSIITRSNSSTHTKPASNERWVALGVDFHPRSEVCEFDKHDELFGQCFESEDCDESLII